MKANVSAQQREAPSHSAKFLRQRKFFLVLPVLTLPFLLLLAWTLGLVGEAKAENPNEPQQGFNLQLPDAALAKDSNWNKLNYYEQADRDSAKLRAMLKNDPYRKGELAGLISDVGTDTVLASLESKDNGGYRSAYHSYPAAKKEDYNERRVQKKLAALHEQLDAAVQEEEKPKQKKDKPLLPETPTVRPDVQKLESMMLAMQNSGDEEDTELKELNQLLEKVMDIQHPERVEERLKAQSQENKRQVFSVEQPGDDIVSLLEAKKSFKELLPPSDSMPEAIKTYLESNRFYGLEEPASVPERQHAIAAVVSEDQTLVSGATVKLRLLEEVFIAGIRVPKGQFIYGLATLHGERLQICVSSISYQNHILPVALSVYDRDGMAGINIPGAITRDVAKRSAAQSVQGLGAMNTLDPSIGAQAVTAGLQMAQNLVGKSAKLVRVSVKAGYQVLLKDDNQKDGK